MTGAKEKKPKIKQKPTRILYNNFAIIAKVFRLTPGYIISTALEGVVYGALNACASVFMLRLFNAMDADPTFEGVLRIVLTLACFYLIARLYTEWYWHYFHAAAKQRLLVKMHRELYEKARTMDLACYDDPVYYNDFVFAMDEAQGRAIAVIEDVGKIINRLLASGTILGVLFTIDPVIAIVLFFCCVADIVLWKCINKLQFRQAEETKPHHRRKNYINRLYYLSDYAKELRISEVDRSLSDAYHESMEKIVETDLRYGRIYFWLMNVVSGLIDNFTYYFALVYMVIRLAQGNVLVGGLAAAVNAVWTLQWLLSDLVNRFTKFPAHSLYIDKYLSFLNYQPTIVSGEGEVGALQSITLENVSFTYETVTAQHPTGAATETERSRERDVKGEKKEQTLRGVSLTVRRGERIALVGYNGAGKTTLIKLLMRLYDPSEGRVLYNGTDIRELQLEPYRARIGTVFQDYKLFGASVAENVLGDMYHGTSEEEARVRDALHAATFDDKLDSLTDGIDTLLTREFDDKGVNLSGGESQKIAIARVFARECDLLILDEPSSALDPLAEYELNHSIAQKAQDKAVIFISHRLSTTRMADRIYMFENGAIIEAGSHEDLMAKNGKYAEMFRLQAEKYKS